MGAASAPAQPSSGPVIQITSLHQLTKLIKDSPALAVDFWSPSCPPCMRIKPFFENLAKTNENENVVFCAVNTMQCRDCAAAHKITAIPHFKFFLGGSEYTDFKGAN